MAGDRTGDDKRLPYIYAEKLREVFGYPSMDALRKAIRRGTFPLPTYKIGHHIVADREAVKEFFRIRREEALKAVRERVLEQGNLDIKGRPGPKRRSYVDPSPSDDAAS